MHRAVFNSFKTSSDKLFSLAHSLSRLYTSLQTSLTLSLGSNSSSEPTPLESDNSITFFSWQSKCSSRTVFPLSPKRDLRSLCLNSKVCRSSIMGNEQETNDASLSR